MPESRPLPPIYQLAADLAALGVPTQIMPSHPRRPGGYLVLSPEAGEDLRRKLRACKCERPSPVPPCDACGGGRVFVTLPCPHCGAAPKAHE